MLLVATLSSAQTMDPPPSGMVNANEKPALLKGIGIDQRLDAQLPLSLAFTDEAGREVRLGDFFGKRPVILALVYYNCPMLCTQVLNGMVGSLNTMSLAAGEDFDVVLVSFDPREKPANARASKEAYLTRYKHPAAAAGWHFLTGREPEIQALAQAVGFRYRYDAALDQFAHASAIYVATPGRPPRALLLRDRVRAAGPAPRAGGGVGGTDRHARRPDPPLLLPLRPGPRQVRRRDHEPRAPGGPRSPSWRSRRRSSVMSRRRRRSSPDASRHGASR